MPTPTPAIAPKPPDTVRKLKTDVFDVVTTSQRLLTQTSTPVAFYNALADLILIQRRAVQVLPGSEKMVEDFNRLLDSIEEATNAARTTNKW